MKSKFNPSLRSTALASAITAFAASSASAATIYQWDGGAGTGNWQTPANWSGDVDNTTDGTINGNNRLNVNGAQALIYTAAEGTTVYKATDNRGLVIGNNSVGTMIITGGTFSTAGSVSADLISNGASGSGTLTINGGNYISGTPGLAFGVASGTGILNVQSGSATITTLNFDTNNSGTINLSGSGTLEVNQITRTRAGGTVTINFDGGTLKAGSGASGAFLASGANALNNAYVKSNGAKIDSNGKTITISQNLLDFTTPSAGGLTLNDTALTAGTLTLSGNNTYTGATTISAGTVSAGKIVVSSGNSNLGNATSAVILGAASTQGTLSYTGNSATYTRGLTIGGAGGGRLNVTTSGQILQVNTGNITGTGLFTIGGAGDTTINANLSHNGGLTKADAGTLTLSNTSTYTGATTVSGGKLVINGNISTSSLTTVQNTGTLDGSGTAGAVTVQDGGRLAAGNGIGSLTAQGNVSLLANSTFEVEINTAASYDMLAISSGSLNITSGAKLDLINFGSANLITLNSRLQLINYTGGTWNGGLLTLGSEELADSETFAWQENTWRINYNDTLGEGDTSLSNGGSYVTLTAIPEPGAALLGGLGMLALLRRRKNG